jgi:ABC-type Fe3+/spermidine/putrescine transport system ATPase subunit
MIKIRNMSVKLGNFSLKEIDLNIKMGEFFVLLGPTGSGKTVLLESIAGLKPVINGQIVINGRNLTGKKPEERNISICYQDLALFPHMQVKDNIKYGLRFKKDANNKTYKNNYKTIVELLRIEHILERYPVFLSGGEKQRVALARALIVPPDVLLLDEPLSALDSGIKEKIEDELANLHKTLGITVIMVTHDFREAYHLASQVGIIRDGSIIQTGPIEDVFNKPNSVFVAEFVGMKNLVKMGELNNKSSIKIPDKNSIHDYIGIRPENIILGNTQLSADYYSSAGISNIKNNGVFIRVDIEFNGIKLVSYVTKNRYSELKLHKGKEIYFGFNSNEVCIIPN